MSLSDMDAERFSQAGFSEYEIERLAESVTPAGDPQPPIDMDVWADALATREAWVEDLLNQGWEWEEIEESILDYYNSTEGASPWDFLKVEYGKGNPKALMNIQSSLQNYGMQGGVDEMMEGEEE